MKYKTIKFGLYPIELVKDPALINELEKLVSPLPETDSLFYPKNAKITDNNWKCNKFKNNDSFMYHYKEIIYNNEKYRALFFLYYHPFAIYSETTFQKECSKLRTPYFFKYVPIDFDIVNEDDDSFTLLSKEAIAYSIFLGNVPYGQKRNNWESSELRRFLNEEFYNDAFNDDEKKRIILSDVLNDKSTGLKPSFNYGSTTKDYLYIPSIVEILNYYSAEERIKRASDYVYAFGIRGDKNCIYYPTRTHTPSESIYIYAIDTNGDYKDNFMVEEFCGSLIMVKIKK